ncbi:DUF262 domain-containing protein [Paenibacillus jamilae]
MPQVNLDALIQREDFEIKDSSSLSQTTQTIQIRDLEKDTFFYNVLRKPDFQRETSDWDVDKICDFIDSFLNGDLIPAIILWNSGAYTFVIDGAHRLSALISWVNDDYGDGIISKSFFDHNIDVEQIKRAEKTRKMVNEKIGNYLEFKQAIIKPQNVKPKLLERAQRLATLALQLQWVKGDASVAEASFFKINQKASPIDKTEFKLLQSRDKPSALAARAIMRAGTGHKYWSKFSDEVIKKVEDLAKEIYALLFTPEYKTPIKTLDLPIAGKGYSTQTLSLIFDLINIVNDVKSDKNIEADKTGDKTINFLIETRRILRRISSTHASSLGLHPVVYFYSLSGRYQPTAFLGVVELLKELEIKKELDKFTEVRPKFENFLVKYKDIVNQIHYKFGSGIKGYKRLSELYYFIFEQLTKGLSEVEVTQQLSKHPVFLFLQFSSEKHFDIINSDFSANTKSATFILEALKSALKCKICGGLIHINSISIDHKVRKEDGGIGSYDNAQLSHLYCNTTYKN